ncbi:DUF2867 domain-containing protein [Rhodohalobacter sp. SW132]|uniref:DUF2867 domain-containing protein n=1 Tax=Rhodohalobacter sp. SW132 TaxID=2293433 RepID=UPI000E255B74|nr:DUF2867 domain-containing protein [Rhodohalobacter sp. SW132]REL33723.1 DUF2867 domain-containing protein [Rhodohalobacter sp. SW132]
MKPRVIEDTVPETNGIKKALPQIDFKDTFAVTNHTDTLEQAAKLVFSSIPPKIKPLFSIRNFLVKFAGLKTTVPDDFNTHFKVGGYIGFLKIHSIEENEIILGGDDKHLNFRVSVFNSGEEEYNIKVTTLVQYQNRMGRIYMFMIKPFHKLVLRVMVKNAHGGIA